jgi:Reverse transcriptase (RNA-dependent DNA polymerase)
VARAFAASPASNLSQLMNTAPVRDTLPDVSSSAAEPVTSVEHMDDDDDDDDRPPGEVLPSDSPHVLDPSHSASEHAFQPNADPVADFPSLRTRSKFPVPDEDDDNSVDKKAEAETMRQRIHLGAALYSYYSTLDEEGDEIDWDQLSDEEFESKMERLKVKERETITHRDIALDRYKDLEFRACDKSKSYCRPLVKYPPVDVFRSERGGMSTQTVNLSHQKKKRIVLLSYDEAKNDPSALQAMEDEIASFKRFDCYEEVSADIVSANANIISTRWIISKKMKDDGTWRSKARLVARGYEDEEKDRASSGSPVASSAAQRLVLALLADKQWISNSLDFTTAFLQGKSLTRDFFVVPPIDFVGSHVVWSLKKPIYGIVSAQNSGSIGQSKVVGHLDLPQPLQMKASLS